MSLAGTPVLDVTNVDFATLYLVRTDRVGVAVAPYLGPPGPHSMFEDRSTPFYGPATHCHAAGADGLLDVSLEDDEGSITRVPHLLALIRPVQMQGPAPRVSIRVTVDRLRATSALRARLSRKIVAVGAEPRVEVEEVGRDDVIMSLSVLSEDLDAKSRLHLLALDVLDNPETSSLPPAEPAATPPEP